MVYVTFETRAVEDRQATIETGAYRTRDVPFAVIRSPGDKNTTIDEQVTPARLALWRTQPHMAKVPDAYEAWKNGQEEPVHGIPLKNWPNITPAQLQMALQLDIRTVEDFAGLNQQGLDAYGLGGQQLKQKAAAYLEAASGPGKVAEQVNSLKAQMEQMSDQLAHLTKLNAEKDAVIATLIPEDKKAKKKAE